MQTSHFTSRRSAAGLFRFCAPSIAAILLFTVSAFFSLANAQSILLASASDFGVLGGSTVTNTGASVINGSVGVWPGTAITGFPPASIFQSSGVIHAGDAVAQQAQSDLTNAYVTAAALPCGANIAGGVLGGLTLAPGVYCMNAGDLTGTLTLSGAGVYVFQMASSLVTAPNSQVVFLAGATSCNVFWQVTSSATVDTNSHVAGNIMALSSITLNTDAVLNGRALARNGQVSLDSNAVTPCISSPTPATPGLATHADQSTAIGSANSDHATLTAGAAPTGTILFEVFGPNDLTCSRDPIFTSSVAVNDNGTYTSAGFIPPGPGLYQWVAVYSGDGANTSAAGLCGDTAEQVRVVAAPLQVTAIPTLSLLGFASLGLLILVTLAWRFRALSNVARN